jgi:hypothetical protein
MDHKTWEPMVLRSIGNVGDVLLQDDCGGLASGKISAPTQDSGVCPKKTPSASQP